MEYDSPNITEVAILGSLIKCMSFSVSYNQHLDEHATPEDYYSAEDIEGLDPSLPIWVLRVYYLTPVGFMEWHTNSIEELAAQLASAADEINNIHS